jgi:preprotein translocase subunit SecB
MNKPPFLLKHYFFPTIFLGANQEFKRQQGSEYIFEIPADEVKWSVHSQKNQSFENCLDVTLRIQIASEGPTVPYQVVVDCIGIFEMDLKYPEIEKITVINGVSMLYSSSRELLLTISSRGPFYQIRLPTVSFAKLGKTEPKEKKK